MNIRSVLNQVREELSQAGTEANRVSGRRFFKEEVKLYGAKTAQVSKISKKYFGLVVSDGKKAVLDLCEQLWQSGYMEESFIACNWSHFVCKDFQPDDFQTFENWVKKYVSNWASCDTFCNHTVGSFLEMYPEYLPRVLTWTESENRWVRRASAVSLIVPARKGIWLDQVFTTADRLLLDSEDMVQKGYGWLLKVASQVHQQEVFDYVMKHKSNMPRTALRYAIEKMPKELKKKAME